MSSSTWSDQPLGARPVMQDAGGGFTNMPNDSHDPSAFANPNPRTLASEPANPGASWSPGPVPVFANPRTLHPVPPESAAETTAPMMPIQAASAFANPAPAVEVSEPANPSLAPSNEPANHGAALSPVTGVSAGLFANPPATAPPAPRRSLLALVGVTEDRAATARGLVGERVHGLRWRYEHREQAARRQEQRRQLHELRLRNREFAKRRESLQLALAPRLGLEWSEVQLTVPVEYDRTSTRTGDVIVRPGETRLPEPSDPEDAPTLPPVRLELPDGFHPETKTLLTGLVKEYLGGEWSARWVVTRHPHYAEFSRDRERPAPPRVVEWKRTDDLYTMHLGHDGTDDVYVSLLTDAPHVGISAGSGKGKTTTILVPLQHARSHGALVDVIDMKEDSLDKAAATTRKNRFNVDVFDDVSGVRIHRDVKSAVAALAEFYVSTKSIRMARERGYDMSQIPPRFLILDEFGSFVQGADFWWKYGLQEKGGTPFRAWFHQILMQGRSKDHRIVVGSHDFDKETFGSTSVRSLIGAKALIRDNTLISHTKAFGQGIKRIKVNEGIKGRAMLQMMPGAPVTEIQLAYTPEEECLQFLLDLPPAPEWFDAGEMAPWITEESIARSHSEMFVAPFLPGGEFATQGEKGAEGSGESMPPMLGQQATPALSVALTESEKKEREDAEIITQREALERGYLPQLVREAEHRQPGRTAEQSLAAALKVMRKARDAGQFPAEQGKGTGGFLYRVADMREWELGRSNRVDFDALSDVDSADDSDSVERGA